MYIKQGNFYGPSTWKKNWDHCDKLIEKLELLMPLAETIKEFDSFIPRGVDLIDHTSIFLLRTVNHYVTLIMCTRYRKTKT